MNKILTLFSFITALVISILLFPEGSSAVLVCLVGVVVAFIVINRLTDDTEAEIFLRQIFACGLLFRVLLAVITYVFQYKFSFVRMP